MGILETLKGFVRLGKALNKIQEYEKIVELQEQVHLLMDENKELRKTITELEEKLVIREDLQCRDNAYWRKNGDGPFCTACWDKDQKLMRILDQDGYYTCSTCKYPIRKEETQKKWNEVFEK